MGRCRTLNRRQLLIRTFPKTWARGVYDRLFGQRVDEAQGEYFDLGGQRAQNGRDVLPQVLAPERKVPELAETLYFRNARRLAAQLLGVAQAEVHGGGHMILKPARYGSETPWHQDEAYWNPEVIAHSLSVWMPLDPARVESGCLQFIPRSHLGEVVPHRHIGDDPLVHGLITEHVEPERAVACPLPAGGATFHHCRTLHYAGPNRTDTPQRDYILVWSAPGRKREAPAHRPWQREEQDALAGLPSLAARQ